VFRVVIPARYASARLPGKALREIAGKPMLQWVYERACAAGAAEVLIATDDERIRSAAHGFGARAVLTARAHASGTDRIAEVARAHAWAATEIIVNVQGDEPLMTAEAIDAAVAPLDERREDVISTLRHKIEDPRDIDSSSVVKVVVDREGYALYFSRSAIPCLRSDAPAPVFWRHIGLYAYRRTFLLTLARLPRTPLEQAEALEQLRALEHGYRIRTVETRVEAVGVDTPEALERVREMLKPASGVVLQKT